MPHQFQRAHFFCVTIIRAFIGCCVILGGLVTDASAQTPSTSSVPVSLEELKVRGAESSQYLNRKRDARHQNGIQLHTKSNLKAFRSEIQPLLQKNCVDCHGEDLQEGNIRVDTLDPDLVHGEDVSWWLEVLAVLTNGEMPPADEVELADTDRTKIIDWLSAEIQFASTARRSEQGHTSFRRMTRYEYNYALQDLLGVPLNFAKDLPPDATSEDGFQNSSEMLSMSAMQFDTYRESARKALQRVTVRGPKPMPLYWRISMKDAAARAWKQQNEELRKLRENHKDAPEKLKTELSNRRLRWFSEKPRGVHFIDRMSGRRARARWSYGGARHAWHPTETPTSLEDAPVSDSVVVIPPRQKLVVELGDRVPDKGPLQIRIRAARTPESIQQQRVPSLQLEFGWQASNDSHSSVRVSQRDVEIDALPHEPRVYEWTVRMSDVYPRNSVRNINKMGDLPSPSEFIKLVNSSVSQGSIQVDYVEIVAPTYEQWPPRSHASLFPTAKTDDSGATKSSSENDGELIAAREILNNFMPRVWRRDVSTLEIERKLDLFERVRPFTDSFQEAVIEVLSTVLSSPNFIYLTRSNSLALLGETDAEPRTQENASKEITSGELATRLAMFLWCSVPDDELLSLAADGSLAKPDVLQSQVDRMLADERAGRFAKHFVRQWLGMQLLDYLDVDRKAYPRFDATLKEAMQGEPIAFFDDVLQKNRSVLDFIHADYTFANERLAKHYGLKDVMGNRFRRVSLQPDLGANGKKNGQNGPSPSDVASRRGGLLTQAGLLAMNSDGKDSHPLKRGIWLLERLLNDPPPPPPPAVPEIDLADPDIAKLTLKQRIEDHRNDPACMSCHAKIDPWGISFENFDALGSWRTTVKDQPVDSTSELFNGQELNGIDGLKRFLLQNRQDQFVRALVHKVTTYALGRPLTFGDRSSVDQITADLREQGDGLATMIRLIVSSDLFQTK